VGDEQPTAKVEKDIKSTGKERLEDFQWVELSKINPKDVSTDFAT